MKKGRLKIHYIMLTILVVVCCLMFVGCGDKKETTAKDTSKFTLDKKNVAVRVNEAEPIKVMLEDEIYAGPVQWVTDNSVVASAAQGYVQGKGVGECVVTAKIPYEGKNYTASCKVTVTSNVSADIYDITAFSGLGDVDITLAQGLYTDGATATVTGVKDCNEQQVDALMQFGEKSFLINNENAPLAPGNYYVTYQITLEDVTKEYVRGVRIKPATSYKDLFVLDAIDGSSKMYGMAANLEYLQGFHRDDEDPGQYVVYNKSGNTGYAKENGISQNLAQFQASLEEAGYRENGGYLKKGDAGADTVYRMYCNKSNASWQPLPFFYLNLQDTANPAWAYLNEDHFGLSPYLSVWFRVWYRESGSDTYQLRTENPGWCYLFNSKNSGEEYVGGGSAYYKNGGWFNATINLFDMKDKVMGTNNLAIGFEIKGDERGEYIFELYSVELMPPLTAEKAEDGTIDVMLPGMYSGLFDSYTYVIKNADGVTVKTGTSENTKVKLEKGEYEITYTLKKGDKTLKERHTRKMGVYS